MDPKINAQLDDEKVNEPTVEKCVAATMEGSLGGAKKALKKSLAKNTTPGKKTQEIEIDVNVEPRAHISKKQDANPFAQILTDEPTTSKKNTPQDDLHFGWFGEEDYAVLENVDQHPISNSSLQEELFAAGKKAQETDVDAEPKSFKRTRDHPESFAAPANVEPFFKKPKINAKDHSVPAKQLEKLQPKTADKFEFLEISRRRIASMARDELEDLAMRKMFEEKKAKCELEFIRKQWKRSESKLVAYQSKISVITKQLHQLDMMGQKSPKRTPNENASKSTSQTIPLKEPKPDPQAPKCLTKVRPAVSTYMSSADGKKRWSPHKKQTSKLTVAKTINNVADTSKLKPDKAPKEKIEKNKAEKETAQEEGGKRQSI